MGKGWPGPLHVFNILIKKTMRISCLYDSPVSGPILKQMLGSLFFFSNVGVKSIPIAIASMYGIFTYV